MKLLKKGVYLRIVLTTLMVLAIFCSVGVTPALAIQKNKVDTVSTAGVQFTDIPTAADSVAIRKKAADSATKAQAVAKQKAQQQKGAIYRKAKNTLANIHIWASGRFYSSDTALHIPIITTNGKFFYQKERQP